MVANSTRTRLLYVLFTSQSLFSAGQIAVFILTAIVATRLAGTESAAGFPGSTLTFAQAFAAFPLALLMGRFGRRANEKLTEGMVITIEPFVSTHASRIYAQDDGRQPRRAVRTYRRNHQRQADSDYGGLNLSRRRDEQSKGKKGEGHFSHRCLINFSS